MKLFGYYLIEPYEKPYESLLGNIDCLYSLSSCFCEQYPDITEFWCDEKFQNEYAEEMKVDRQRFDQLYEMLCKDFCFPGSYFRDPATARVLLETFKQAGRSLKMLSMHLDEQGHDSLLSIINEGNTSDYEDAVDDETGKEIGRDILGYEANSFHSWLCNGLHRDEISDKSQVQPIRVAG